jgi:hypothetical protein
MAFEYDCEDPATRRNPCAAYRTLRETWWLVWGRTPSGRALQVVFVLDEDDTIYVIHARDLT